LTNWARRTGLSSIIAKIIVGVFTRAWREQDNMSCTVLLEKSEKVTGGSEARFVYS
jgi:hypothetical protein